MESALPSSRGPLPIVRSEADILPLALQAAARKGDPSPQLVQHTTGTREAATKTTGSWVRSDQLSYLIAIRGRFTARRGRGPSIPPEVRHDDSSEYMSWTVQVLVIDIETGRVTDSGGSNDYPDLASVGPVVTDYRASIGGHTKGHKCTPPRIDSSG